MHVDIGNKSRHEFSCFKNCDFIFVFIGENNVFHSPSQFGRDHQRPLESDKMMRKEKPGAPPTESLYTTKKHSSSSGDESIHQRHQTNNINNFEETMRNHFHPEHHNDSESMKSPAQIDPFFAEGYFFTILVDFTILLVQIRGKLGKVSLSCFIPKFSFII